MRIRPGENLSRGKTLTRLAALGTLSRNAQGCPGKILRPNKGGNRPNNVVLAGLVPRLSG
jgi:hypothetical protein